jgi:hypothetical protein
VRPQQGTRAAWGSGDDEGEKKSSALPWILGGLAVAGVGVGAWWYWKKGLGDGAKSVFASNPHEGLTTLPSAPARAMQGRRSNPIRTDVLELVDHIHQHEDRHEIEFSDKLLEKFFQGNPSEEDVGDLLLALSVFRLTPETMYTVLDMTRRFDSGARRRFFDEVRRRLYDMSETTALVDEMLRTVR